MKTTVRTTTAQTKSSFTHTTATMTADFFAKKAADHAATCTDSEKRRRQENGRRTNVSHIFTEEETDAFFLGTLAAGSESEHQPSRFGGAVFAHA